jgi:hypothetical protein
MNSIQLLTTATTAIRDIQAGYRDNDIVAPSGRGVNALLRDLVTYLRENGVDDEGAWDCDATEGIAVRKTPDFEPFILVAQARAANEFGEGPEYAEIRVTPQFVEKLVRLSRLCEEHGLRSVTTGDAAVDRWDQEDELRIRGDSLRVYGDDFWFEAYPKYGNYNVETVAISIADLASVATLSTEGAGFHRVGDKVFYVDDADALDGLIALYEGEYEDDEDEGATCDECGTQVDRLP